MYIKQTTNPGVDCLPYLEFSLSNQNNVVPISMFLGEERGQHVQCLPPELVHVQCCVVEQKSMQMDILPEGCHVHNHASNYLI